jgi:putative spermidine/putrescine transport system ATP-binding protein
MSAIRFEGVTKSYDGTVALAGFDLGIQDGEFLALLGPSGCGKTTALRLVAGFLQPTSGRILIDGRNVSSLPPHRRNAGMVFQDYALFPHMSVADNIAFGLHERRQSGNSVTRRVGELLELVKLRGMEKRFPGELSGGQQQRVALARALAFEPSVLLMDEPFGALDLKLRDAMQSELVQIQRSLKITTLFVTHDQGEAMAMAHRIAVMNGGRIEQLGNPDEIYNRPKTAFVAEFVGKVNLLPASVQESDDARTIIDLNGMRLVVSPHPRARAGAKMFAAMRPENLRLSTAPLADNQEDPAGFIAGTVTARRFSGSSYMIEVLTAQHGRLLVELRADDGEFPEDNSVFVRWPAEKTILLDKEH